MLIHNSSWYSQLFYSPSDGMTLVFSVTTSGGFAWVGSPYLVIIISNITY
jgi:hypothetical protein